MKNLFYFLTMMFSVLCFASAQYVFITGGEAGTTFAIAFLVFAYAFSWGYNVLADRKAMIAKLA